MKRLVQLINLSAKRESKDKMLVKRNIVVFDFDGTLSWRDSNFEFGKYCFKHSARPWMYLPLIVIAYIGRFFNPAGIWWRKAMRRFITPQMVRDFVPGFISAHKKLRFDWAKSTVAHERAAGNIVILISASTDYLVPRLVQDMNFDVILTSKMNSDKPWQYDFLCWGPNKVIALDNWARKNKIIPNVIRAYSDSKSDLPIMNIAKEQIWVDRKTGSRMKKH